MHIVVMGAGGVGGFYGGVLARSGQKVTFIARGAHLAALRQHGLKVESQAAGDFSVAPVSATDNPAQAGPADLILFTTKAYDLEDAARSLKPLLGPETMVLPLLNGVDISERLVAVLGAKPVLGGMCQVSTSIKAPGVIRQVGPLNLLVFGELAGGASPRTQALLGVLKEAKINAELSADIRVDLWSKYLAIDAMGGVCALTVSTLGPVVKDPDTRALLQGCAQEIEALARAQGVPLKPTIVQEWMARWDKLPPETKPSLLLSVEQGGKLEVDALPGTAVRLGKQLGIPTPINQFIYAALKLRAEGRKTA